MNPLRIGIVGYPSLGGSGVVATELAHELARNGHDVHIFSRELPFRLDPSRGHLSFHVVRPPDHPVLVAAPYDMALAGTIADAAQQSPLDILHVHFAVPHASAAWMATRILGDAAPALVVTLHGSDVTILGDDPALRPALRFALSQADAVTAVSRYLADDAHARLDLPRAVDVVPNFVNLRVYRPQPDPDLRERYANPGEAVVVHASNFRPVKRVEDVVRVFAALARRQPARLLLVGDGPDCPKAYRTAKAEGVSDRVLFLGAQPRISELLGIADLFLLPSDSEGFGLAALEAMACGVPVVASQVGGLPEVVEHGVSGLLYPVGDVAAMAKGALSLLNDGAFRDRVRAAALERVRERFCVGCVVPGYERIYARALEARRAAPSPHPAPVSACGD